MILIASQRVYARKLSTYHEWYVSSLKVAMIFRSQTNNTNMAAKSIDRQRGWAVTASQGAHLDITSSLSYQSDKSVSLNGQLSIHLSYAS